MGREETKGVCSGDGEMEMEMDGDGPMWRKRDALSPCTLGGPGN